MSVFLSLELPPDTPLFVLSTAPMDERPDHYNPDALSSRTPICDPKARTRSRLAQVLHVKNVPRERTFDNPGYEVSFPIENIVIREIVKGVR
ncbi:hypothetical protein H4R33_003737 [Dimargaris cristalligena]|nr:hypothetical protein H4R33_003737 [Dimargaris cristalligena]